MSLSFAEFPGLGDGDVDGFPAHSCPEVLPDLSRHFSITADVLKAAPDIYTTLKDRQTSLGVTLARCIKTGMDNKGHPMIKALGAVAGDAECFETFSPLFDRLLQSRTGEAPPRHAERSGRTKLTAESAEPYEGYVLSCTARVSRNLEGIRFPPAATLADRCEVERLLAKGLLQLEGPLKGEYFPLAGSTSFSSKPNGMTQQEEKVLADDKLLFYYPDSAAVLSTGSGRHWPNGRGVFVNESRSFTAWVNEEEHLRATSMLEGGNVQRAYQELRSVLQSLESSLRSDSGGRGFAQSERLGYLNACPTNLGTAMRVSVIVKLPLLMENKDQLLEWCSARRLYAKGAVNESGIKMPGFSEVSNCDRIGVTEEETVNVLIEAVAQLVRAERLMEQGVSFAEALTPSTPAADGLLTPVFTEASQMWDEAGHALEDILSMAVTSSTSHPLEEVSRSVEEIRQHVAGMLLVASRTGAFEKALDVMRQEPSPPDTEAERMAALKIQAIQRGKLGRQRVEKEKKDKMAAATRIQAVQRGKKERKEIEDMRVQKTEAAKKVQALQRGRATRNDTASPQQLSEKADPAALNRLRPRLLQVLSTAANSGQLELALKEAHDEELRGTSDIKLQSPEHSMEELRMKLAQQLEVALGNGTLEAAFCKSFGQPAKMIVVKEELRNQLVASSADGSLAAALSEVKAQAPQLEANLEELRERIARQMSNALEDGSLAEAIKRTKPPNGSVAMESKISESDAETLRQRLGNQLSSSLHDGSLEASLQSVVAARAAEVDLELVRAEMAHQLVTSSADGTLDAALAEAFINRKQSEHVDALRVKMAQQLEASLNDGSLETALRKTFASTEVDSLRLKMAQQLETSLSDGSLEAALQTVFAKKPQCSDIAGLQAKLAEQLQASLADGSLEAALQKTFAPKQSDPAIDDLRVRMAQLLETSLSDGSLEAALAANVQAEQQSNELEDARTRMAQQLEACLADGSLDAALQKSFAPKQSDTAIDDLRIRMAQLLKTSLSDGSLEAALAANAQAKHPSDELEDIRSKMAQQLEASLRDGSLEAALAANAQAKHQSDELEDVRSKMAQQLEASLSDGSLEAALAANAQAKHQSDELEDIRSKMAQQLEASLSDGSLEAALAANAQAKHPSDELEDIRSKMAQQLEASLLDGSLESALEANAQAKQGMNVQVDNREAKMQADEEFSLPATVMTPRAGPSQRDNELEEMRRKVAYLESALSAPKDPVQAAPQASAYPLARRPSARARQGAAGLLQVMSSYDRRIGKLMESIQAAERALMEKEQQASVLKVEIDAAHQDLHHLDQALMHNRSVFEVEEVRDIKLQEQKRKLQSELEMEKMKERHACVDMDSSYSWSRPISRAEMNSTVCSVRDLGGSSRNSPLMTIR